MALEGTVLAAEPGLLGFDANTVLSAAIARTFSAGGFRFCLRYISRGEEPAGDLSAGEANDILDAGLALMPVQHVRPGYWKPTGALGQQDGTAAGHNAGTVGFPPGTSVWCDLEAVDQASAANDVIDYCEGWYAAVSEAGYAPGLYVGYQSGLAESELVQLRFTHYWRSQSNVPNAGRKGYQLIQLYPELSLFGIKADVDVTQEDYQGGHAVWLVRGAAGEGFRRRARTVARRRSGPSGPRSTSAS